PARRLARGGVRGADRARRGGRAGRRARVVSLDARLRALGVHRRPLLALLRAFLLVDIRHQAGARARGAPSAATPFALVLWQLMGTSLLASVVLFARVDVWLFALITLTLSATLLGLVLLSEFADLLLDTADVHVVGPH